jgi:hypothetical protein
MDKITLEAKREQFIAVVLCEPGKEACVTTIPNNLESLQKTVGGYIEAVYPFEDPVAIICNEEGKLNSMELNRALRDESGQIYDILAGPFFLAGLGDEDFASLSEELQQKYCNMFKHPEMFFWDGNQIRVIPL